MDFFTKIDFHLNIRIYNANNFDLNNHLNDQSSSGFNPYYIEGKIIAVCLWF